MFTIQMSKNKTNDINNLLLKSSYFLGFETTKLQITIMHEAND